MPRLRRLLLSIFPSTVLLARAALAPSAAEVTPLPVGAAMPAVAVQAADGSSVDLAAASAGRLTLLVFYRGSWCPYCNKHLAALQEIEPQLLKLGFQILAVSPDEPAGLRTMAEKNRLNYRLLSDRAMRASSALGLAFRVDAATVAKYREYKIDLPPVPGEPEARWLPVPAAYLIGRDGAVQFAHVNADYKIRVDTRELLAAARRAAAR